MTDLPDIPISDEAQELLARIMPRIKSRLNEVNRVPVSVLLWGPGIESSSPISLVRAELRSTLRSLGHAAFYSEELYDESDSYSLRLQQLAQAQEFDLIVSMPCTPGSIGEIHDFAADRRVHSKILVFLDSQYSDGYSAKSIVALETVLSCQIEYYNGGSVDCCEGITRVTCDNVQRIREMKYIGAGRY